MWDFKVNETFGGWVMNCATNTNNDNDDEGEGFPILIESYCKYATLVNLTGCGGLRESIVAVWKL